MSEEYKKLSDALSSTSKKYNLEKISDAFEYARQLHDGQFRKSGEPYISHPVAVAEIVVSLGLDTDSICAALLHDTVEDCPDKTNLDNIKNRFGDDVAMLVDGLTKIVFVNIEDKEEAHIENIRKMLLAVSKDIRVIFIKLCDRLHNMRTLAAMREEKRRSIALETMYVYAPLAHRLGMQRIKQELENLSLCYLDPIGYEEVSNEIDKKYGQSRYVLENAKKALTERMRENNINFTLEGRVKSIYSLYRKMYNQNKSFDEIYDFYALRLIVGTELECYTALGLVHEMYKSVPGRFKDYISTPKPNLYRSLHTTVIGRDGIPFEVQIRTYDMHHIAEYGIAAHWKYKSGEKSKEEVDQKLSWIARLIEIEEDSRDPDEFMDVFKNDIFHDETFIFTPKGDVISLPLGSTVIDFAYAIHSAVGNKMTGAKINGKIVPITTVPKTGDIVEILTSAASRGPSRDWLKTVTTSDARNKIRQWFKKEKRSENIIVGRGEVERELDRIGKAYNDNDRDAIAAAVAKRMGIQSADDLYNTIGFGGLSITKISAKIRDEFDRIIRTDDVSAGKEEVQVKVTEKPKNLKHGSGIIVDGAEGCLVKFAKCCNPLPGDDVIGFITKGFGISIHKQDCPNVISGLKNKDMVARWVDAHWEHEFVSQASGGLYEALIRVYADNDLMLIANVSAALADMKVVVTQINTQKLPDSTMLINLTVGCKDVGHFSSIVSRLKNIHSVIRVTRGFTQ